MKKANICLAKKEDLNKLYELEIRCFPRDRISLSEYKRILNKSTVKIFVIKSNIKLIGSAIIFFKKNLHKARLYSFAVDIEYRRTGSLFNCIIISKNLLKTGIITR